MEMSGPNSVVILVVVKITYQLSDFSLIDNSYETGGVMLM